MIQNSEPILDPRCQPALLILHLYGSRSYYMYINTLHTYKKDQISFSFLRNSDTYLHHYYKLSSLRLSMLGSWWGSRMRDSWEDSAGTRELLPSLPAQHKHSFITHHNKEWMRNV